MTYTLRQLEHAEALARHENFREAAIALKLSQPALTRSIQALEQALGMVLFDRLSTGVQPTPAGALMLATSKVILQEKRELEREMRLLSTLEAGSLTISMGPYPGHVLVPRVVGRLLRKHPRLAFRLSDVNWIDIPAQLLARESDLAVAELSVSMQDERLSCVAIGDDQMHFACRRVHPLAGRGRLALADVIEFPLVGCRSPGRLGALLGADSRAGSIDGSTGHFIPAVEVETLSAAKMVAVASDAVMAATLTQLEPELKTGQLLLLPVANNPLRLHYGFIYLRSRTLSPAAHKFIGEFRTIKKVSDRRERQLARQYAVDQLPAVR